MFSNAVQVRSVSFTVGLVQFSLTLQCSWT